MILGRSGIVGPNVGGSCSSFGCATTAYPNPTGAKPIYKIITDKPVVNIPGCPPIAEVIVGTIVHLITFDSLPELDSLQLELFPYNQVIWQSKEHPKLMDVKTLQEIQYNMYKQQS